MSMILQAIVNHGHKRKLDTAILVDDLHYTYRDLYDDVIERVQGIEYDNCITQIMNGERHIILIDTESVYEQLILWLAALDKGYIPIVLHPHMDNTYRTQLMNLLGSIDIPIEAQFGVLTSGTTGIPKPLWRTEKSWADYFDIQNNIFHIDDTTSIFVHGSFSFTGNTNMILAVLWAGGQIITSDYLQPKRWQSLIQSHRCTHMYMLPTKLRLLLRWNRSICSCVRYIIAGSQVVDRELLQSLHMLYPTMEFILYYGASELNYISYCTGKEWHDYPGTVGRPFPGVIVEIKDDYIYVSTRFGICGLDGMVTVGDKGHWCDDYLIFDGRNGDIINRGGYKVAVLALESQLQMLPTVEDVAVISIPDGLRGEEVVAFIVPVIGVTSEEVESDVRQSIPHEDQPKYLRYIDAIPLTDCSKIDKELLKEWYNKE